MSALLAFDAGPALLAHQNGWDEFLLVAGPMVVITGLLWLAKRRVDAAHAARPLGGTDGEAAGARPGGEPATVDRPDEPSRP